MTLPVVITSPCCQTGKKHFQQTCDPDHQSSVTADLGCSLRVHWLAALHSQNDLSVICQLSSSPAWQGWGCPPLSHAPHECVCTLKTRGTAFPRSSETTEVAQTSPSLAPVVESRSFAACFETDSFSLSLKWPHEETQQKNCLDDHSLNDWTKELEGEKMFIVLSHQIRETRASVDKLYSTGDKILLRTSKAILMEETTFTDMKMKSGEVYS